MIARGFRPVAWVGAIGAAALSCYMLSLQVASERAELAGLERQIVTTQQDIRALQTELGTRGRLQQLEQWNADVLALSAPVSGQFLPANVSLARFDRREPAIDQAPVRLASAEMPAPASTVALPPQQAALRQAPAPAFQAAPPVLRASLTTAPGSAPAQARGAIDAPRPAVPARATAEASRRPDAAPVRTAAATTRAPAPLRAAPQGRTPPRAAAAPTAREPAARRAGTPQRTASLLGEATMRDLRDEARAERRGGTRN